MTAAVGFLQNAWSGMYAGGAWPRESWLRALHACHTGRRLARLTAACPGVEWWWDNTTPVVGPTPASVVPPDPDHIRSVLARAAPDLVVTFGRQAAAAVGPLWPGRIVGMPHPAWRFCTNSLIDHAAELIVAGGRDRAIVALQAVPGGKTRYLPTTVPW